MRHQYSLQRRAPKDHGVLAWCPQYRMPLLAWPLLASGFLADGVDLSVIAA